mmetsp:Transcript_23385/g.46714  ORF Transcript_23385/g.46714 Transcript_23385/m.46714 type:complete len:99 (-) Transcript_23385:215-511(-)|eukprot:CAMPEP_0174705498 /NCGR_PEP_ID=MMETSP1094-20130205/8708_1 /TAXON_ID=156173 /ORGANISM="Chrysochromulina brevifilum, Strain UTEX LB 985" /LENGTH=98 /DNA_ID=CAMNT_0015903675 /DNA_START=247 /DNA_END=543 /DNA_ORIENTATION=+
MSAKPKFVTFDGGGEESRPSDDGDLRPPPLACVKVASCPIALTQKERKQERPHAFCCRRCAPLVEKLVLDIDDVDLPIKVSHGRVANQATAFRKDSSG